ncbi:unnamed protein product [Peronospora farinosa]|uniref:RxLR effector protein n=1 Tax=Peronospora farinosa TaxID=134698 RepID=A0AAV0ST95_9STRA|nr:unnamed protein product [Peronospora farinosa]CAI5707924.1 unnamed protein product [Peronospora farinosa]
MHLPCVLIFFAVATRPVGVGAHVTDDQYEVVRHLRVQERAHGKDKDERMNNLNLSGEEEISTSNLHNLVEKYRMEIPNFDLYKPSPTDIFLDKLLKLQETNSRPTYAFNFVMAGFNEEELSMIFKEANERFAAQKLDPQTVFKLYQLDLVGDTLFKQPQMVYWVQYRDLFIRTYPVSTVPRSLLFTLLKYFGKIEYLVVAVTKAPEDKNALRVEAEIRIFWFEHQNYTPEHAFLWLHLNKYTDYYLFPFWIKYVTYYNSKVSDHSKVSMLSVMEKYSLSLLTVLGTVEKTDATLQLENEVKNMLLHNWRREKRDGEEVLHDVRTGPKPNTVYGKALEQATIAYIKSLPE